MNTLSAQRDIHNLNFFYNYNKLSKIIKRKYSSYFIKLFFTSISQESKRKR